MAYGATKAAKSYSPHFLLDGLEPRHPWDMLQNADPPGDKLAARADAELSIAYAAMSMKAQYDDKHQPTHFIVGD